MARLGRRSRNNRMRGGLHCAMKANPTGACHEVHKMEACTGVWVPCQGNNAPANSPANAPANAPANTPANAPVNSGNNELAGGRRRIRSRRFRGGVNCNVSPEECGNVAGCVVQSNGKCGVSLTGGRRMRGGVNCNVSPEECGNIAGCVVQSNGKCGVSLTGGRGRGRQSRRRRSRQQRRRGRQSRQTRRR